MADMDYRLSYALPFAAGVISHVGYFVRGEHHMYGLRYLQVFFGTTFLAVFILTRLGSSLGPALLQVSSQAGLYFAGLYTSLLIYRAFLHPLNKFPGAFGARISSFWFMTQLKDRDVYRQLQRLHDKHGDFVRVGPSTLSITHVDAVKALDSSESKCIKGDWYDISQPRRSLQTLRPRPMHDKRRQVWSKAFSVSAVKGYEKRIQTFQNKFLSQLEKFNGQPLNMSKWFNLYSFDIMGDLAFGTSFHMLEKAEEHWAIKLLNAGLTPLTFQFPVWFFRLVATIPGAMNDWWKFIGYCDQMVEQRKQMKPDVPDIMSALLEPLKGREPTQQERDLLSGDSQLIVVAGSDTTAATLTAAVLGLCRNPIHIQKLREELAPFMPDPKAEVLDQNIAKLDHLNGVLYEAMRLYPAVPSGWQRQTPPEGIMIGGTHIPGNMTLQSPQYVMSRKEEYYTQAHSFIPERWYSRPELVKEKGAWAPFNGGPYGCIGRPLAMVSLRTTLARLVMRFDISFPPDEPDSGRKFDEKLWEHFTLALAELKVCLTPRKF